MFKATQNSGISMNIVYYIEFNLRDYYPTDSINTAIQNLNSSSKKLNLSQSEQWQLAHKLVNSKKKLLS